MKPWCVLHAYCAELVLLQPYCCLGYLVQISDPFSDDYATEIQVAVVSVHALKMQKAVFLLMTMSNPHNRS